MPSRCLTSCEYSASILTDEKPFDEHRREKEETVAVFASFNYTLLGRARPVVEKCKCNQVNGGGSQAGFAPAENNADSPASKFETATPNNEQRCLKASLCIPREARKAFGQR